MDPMNGQKLVVMNINDILDELMVENKRLINELLFANNCFNELKTHLINIHSKYETIIDCEDIRRWDQLNDKISDGLLSKELVKKLDLNSNEDIDVKQQYLCSFKDCNKGFKRKCHLKRHSVSHSKSQPISPSNERPFSQRRRQTLETKQTIDGKSEDISDDSDSSYDNEVDEESDDSYVEPKSSTKTKTKTRDPVIQHLLDSLRTNRSERQKYYDSTAKAYKCPINDCHKTYKTDITFYKHLYNYTNEKTFKCQYIDCNQTFEGKCELRSHLKSHLKPTDGQVIIDDLDSSTQSLYRLLRFNRTERKKYLDLATNWYICPINDCNKKYSNDGSFVNHINVYHTNRRFVCQHEDCNKQFRTRNELKCHSVIHSKREPMNCPYDDCNYHTFNDNKLAIHLQKHICPTNKTYVCQHVGCDQTFATIDGRKTHQRVQHQLAPTFKCGIDGCKEMFKSDRRRRVHQTQVHNRAPINYSYVKHHCDWPGCDYYGNNLLMHKRRIHTGERPYPCEWPGCDKRFLTRTRYDDHMKIHTNTKPHTCNWPGCNYRAVSKHTVDRHIRIHTGEKPYPCEWPECGKRFNTIEIYRRHMDVHTRTKPYPCEWSGCQYRGATKYRVKLHIKARHRLELT